jgi:HAD superfamily hydrolase (TIGR01509 family)
MIKVLLFDLGGVVFQNGTKLFLHELAAKYNLGIEFVNQVINGEKGDRYREGKMSRDAFWEAVVNELGIHADIDTLEEEWINKYTLIEETKAIIDELKKEYKLYFLSDNVRERVEKISLKHNFLEWFEGGIFSHEVGVRKPHPNVYKAAIKKIGVSPEEMIFIDDKEENLPPAEELGMNVLLFSTPHQLREDLLKLGVILSL